MRTSRRHFLATTTAAALIGSAALTAQASAASYPSQPITVVVPHAPGGPVDSVARLFANKLQDELKQNVVVENRAGASSMIGAAHVARSTPDGYTLYINASIHSINPLLYKDKIQFDAVNDFTAISLLAQGPLLFLVNPSVKATTAKDFAEEMKADPNKFSFATGGFGAADHLASAYFLHESGQKNIPIALYKGGAPALQDLIGGSVSAKMDAILTALPLVQADKVRALAVTSAQRSPLLPDVPTMQEAGFDGFEFSTWYGLWAPANLPADVTETLNQAAERIMQLPEMQEKLASLGFTADYRGPDGFAKFVDSEMARYQTIITDADIRVD